MTYRCTPHSGAEMSPSYLMLNRQIKNVFDLLHTKPSKIEIKNLEHQVITYNPTFLNFHKVKQYQKKDCLYIKWNGQFYA